MKLLWSGITLAVLVALGSDPDGRPVAVAAGVLWAAGYLLACWLWPFVNHHRCRGSGKRRSPSGRAWRPCRRCHGSGKRLRVGRRVWLGLRNTIDQAQR